MRRLALVALLCGSAAAAAAPAGAQAPAGLPLPSSSQALPLPTPLVLRPPWRSRAIGLPHRGRLAGAVQLPMVGPDHLTWDSTRAVGPNPGWRRWGTDRLVSFLLRGLARYRAAHPQAPPVLVADLSRQRGGTFDRRYGGLGHASHQNGLDADVLFPRRDRTLRAPMRASDVDRLLAQGLVDALVAEGAQYAFVGRLGLRGPRGVVQVLPHHDDHLHVRIRPGTTGASPK